MKRRLLAKAIKYSMSVAPNDYGISNLDYSVRVESLSGSHYFSYSLNHRGRAKLLKHGDAQPKSVPLVSVDFLSSNSSIYQQIVHGPHFYRSHRVKRGIPIEGKTILPAAQAAYTMDFSLPSGDADNNSLDANLVFPR